MLRMLKSFAVSFSILVGPKLTALGATESLVLSLLAIIILPVYANVEAKINGKQLLNNISALNSELKFSLGFKFAIEERAGQVRMYLV